MEMKGYLKSIEAVMAIVLVLFILAQVQPVFRTLHKWDELTLQKAGEDALMTLSYTGELREKVYSENYSSLNSSFYELIPSYISFNLIRDNSSVITNGDSDKKITVVFFLSGHNSYNPAVLKMQLWYGDD